ncbi:hypothetical protein E2C01_017835 [Portunus trituberculatus]|uniref:Uncharacterized protein n=1 Tax=Portunus trituberculatus TaxID=210409 RepID=A0A5B7DT04_PORTR|nr:hypothetical protein [Portunus trituberculatus]
MQKEKWRRMGRGEMGRSGSLERNEDWHTWKKCLSSGLLNEKNPTPPLTIGSGITLRLKPQNAVKQLIIHAALEDDNEQEVYELGITENMQVVWGDMEVTLKDSKTRNNVFKSGGKESVSPGPVMVSSTRGGKQKESREAEDGCGLQPPRVTVGVVSSRAPSPGNEVDETTMDYVNKAFLYEN